MIKRLAGIENELFKNAKKYIIENSEYSPFVISNFISQAEVFPIVIIEETDDSLSEETLSLGEQKLDLTYEIEIYAMDKVVNGKKIARQVIIDELKNIINDVFENQYGFTRMTSTPRQNIDLDVSRFYMRFEGVYDTVNKKIFRR